MPSTAQESSFEMLIRIDAKLAQIIELMKQNQQFFQNLEEKETNP
jgi:hypothetical protein